MTEIGCGWWYRHSGSPRDESSRLLDFPEFSTNNTSPTKHRVKSPENVLAHLSDSNDLEPSDLTIIASPGTSARDVDKTVEQTCEKIKLTASNVRSIIRVSVSPVVLFHL